MGDPRRDDQCIERRGRRGFIDNAYYYSVREYEDDLNRGKCFAPKTKSVLGLIWTRDAPRPEYLTEEWRKTTEGSFRICDPELYDQQMREFVGLV